MLLNYLKANKDKHLTAADIGTALGMSTKQVDGVFTAAFQRQGLGIRIPAQVIDVNGLYVNVKYLTLTDAGLML